MASTASRWGRRTRWRQPPGWPNMRSPRRATWNRRRHATRSTWRACASSSRLREVSDIECDKQSAKASIRNLFMIAATLVVPLPYRCASFFGMIESLWTRHDNQVHVARKELSEEVDGCVLLHTGSTPFLPAPANH